jgi:Nucleotidyl transferase of unknown function (DUF2204)
MAEHPEVFAPLLTALKDLVAWLQDAAVSGTIIGGVAASLLGRPRVTRDIDALVLLDESEWETFLAAGKRFGFVPRLSDVVTFAHQARVLLVRHAASGIDIDIAFGALPFEEEAVRRTVWHDVGGVRIPLPLPEDLLIMKAVAHRPRDMADIESILDAQPQLDLPRVRRWLREFSTALETPELLRDFNALVAQRRKRKKPS